MTRRGTLNFRRRIPASAASVNEVVHSVNGVPIRLSSERWTHIVEHHDDLAGHYHAVLETVRSPDAVHEGDGGELLAVSSRFTPYWLVVAYRRDLVQ